MTRIGLVVTGESERLGMAPALARIFPQAEFELVPGRVDGFTSRVIPQQFVPSAPSEPDLDVEKLVNTLLGAVTDRKSPFDYAVLIDDLETENWGQVPVVVSYFRQAVRATLTRETPRSSEVMRERCSFHLLHPMLEALFFADRRALDEAGASPGYVVQRAPGDVELFTVTDTTYLAEPDEPKVTRKKGTRWWAVPARLHKPKHYLMYLSEQPGGTKYHETEGGVNALKALDWKLLFSPPTEVTFARSLIEDIASMLNVANPHPGDCAPETSRADGQNVLRNL